MYLKRFFNAVLCGPTQRDTVSDVEKLDFSESSPLLPPEEVLLTKQLIEPFKLWRVRQEYVPLPKDRLRFPKAEETPFKYGLPSRSRGLVRLSHRLWFYIHLLFVRRTKRYFHLACPFYQSAPEKYQKCLLAHDLQSIVEVTRHLVNHHSHPLYCPICHEVFDDLIGRDDHTLERICKSNDQRPLHGLSEGQKAVLMKLGRRSRILPRNIDLGRPYSGEKELWYEIWSIVFPDAPGKPPSPYLDRGPGLTVSMAYDFWDLCWSRDVLSRADHEDNDVDQALEEFLNGIIEQR